LRRAAHRVLLPVATLVVPLRLLAHVHVLALLASRRACRVEVPLHLLTVGAGSARAGDQPTPDLLVLSLQRRHILDLEWLDLKDQVVTRRGILTRKGDQLVVRRSELAGALQVRVGKQVLIRRRRLLHVDTHAFPLLRSPIPTVRCALQPRDASKLLDAHRRQPNLAVEPLVDEPPECTNNRRVGPPHPCCMRHACFPPRQDTRPVVPNLTPWLGTINPPRHDLRAPLRPRLAVRPTDSLTAFVLVGVKGYVEQRRDALGVPLTHNWIARKPVVHGEPGVGVLDDLSCRLKLFILQDATGSCLWGRSRRVHRIHLGLVGGVKPTQPVDLQLRCVHARLLHCHLRKQLRVIRVNASRFQEQLLHLVSIIGVPKYVHLLLDSTVDLVEVHA